MMDMLTNGIASHGRTRARKRALLALTAISAGLTLALMLIFAVPILAGEAGPPDPPEGPWWGNQAPAARPADDSPTNVKQEITREDKAGRLNTLLQGTISAGDVSLFIDPIGLEDNADFEVPLGQDHMYQTWWWFRIAGDTEETPMPAPDSETYSGNTAVFTWTDVLTRGFDAHMVVTVSDEGNAAGSLTVDLTISNTTGSALAMDWFAYTDFDLAGTFISDTAVLINANDHIQIFKDSTVVDYQGVGVQAYEVTSYPLLLDSLNDTSVTNLANTGLPFGPDDFTGGFQWSTTIPSGGAETFQEMISVQGPAIELVKTVGTAPGVCATTSTITVPIGTDVYYCYEVTNTSPVTLPFHDLADSVLGPILTGFAFDLAPGASVDTVAAGLTLSATITNTLANTATWTAYDPLTTDYAIANAGAVVNAIPPLVLTKTVGLDPNTCASTDSLALTAPADVTYCYEVTNTTLVYTYSIHDVFDSRLGTLLGPGFLFDLTPGSSAFFTVTATITETTVNQGDWIASGPGIFSIAQDRAVVSLVPSISLTKTVGLTPGVCATTDSVNANSEMPVYYCYEVANTGLFTLPLHDLTDSELGTIFSDFPYDLTPGASVDTVAAGLTLSATVDHTTVNTGTWTAAFDQAVVVDPMGDAFFYFGSGPIKHDILTFTVSSDPLTLTLTVAFSDTISPGDSGMPDAVVGNLEIDVDENPLTGVDTIGDLFQYCPDRANLGVEYIVGMFSYNSGTGQTLVFDASSFNPVGVANVTFYPKSFTVEVPLAVLGGDDGLVDVATVLGTIPEPTDCAPNGGSISNDPISATASDTATVNSYPLFLPVVNKN